MKSRLLSYQHALFSNHLAGSPQRRRPVALSLEMFEADTQPVVDEWLAGEGVGGWGGRVGWGKRGALLQPTRAPTRPATRSHAPGVIGDADLAKDAR